MSLDPQEVERAFQFFLRRAPSDKSRAGFNSVPQLFSTLMGSSEYRQSPRGWKNAMQWPLRQVFVVPEARVLYCPIGKNGCSFLKAQMVRLARTPDEDFILRDVHLLTDHVNTGLQLSDYPRKQARAFVADDSFMKFAVLRQPHDRLLSAWMEKFVLNRHEPGNRLHTGPVIAAVQGQTRPDFHRSVSFAEFITHVCSAKAPTLDPHWRPQHLYLKGIDYTHLFAFERLNDVVDALEAWTGISLPRKAVNTTGSGDAGGMDLPGAHLMEPPVLDALPRVAKTCFFDDRLNKLIEDAYAKDIALLETIGPKS